MSGASFLDYVLYGDDRFDFPDDPPARLCAVTDCTIPPGNNEHCEAHA